MFSRLHSRESAFKFQCCFRILLCPRLGFARPLLSSRSHGLHLPRFAGSSWYQHFHSRPKVGPEGCSDDLSASMPESRNSIVPIWSCFFVVEATKDDDLSVEALQRTGEGHQPFGIELPGIPTVSLIFLAFLEETNEKIGGLISMVRINMESKNDMNYDIVGSSMDCYEGRQATGHDFNVCEAESFIKFRLKE